jgi:ABC-type multidrug transport system fused ATPase/permease subunit
VTLIAETTGFWGWFFLFLIFIPMMMLWVYTLVDIFQRVDLSGWAKALWVIFVLVLPLLGMLIYFIARPILPQDVQRQQQYEKSIQAEQAADVADKLSKLSELRDKGVISEEEFQAQKAKLL